MGMYCQNPFVDPLLISAKTIRPVDYRCKIHVDQLVKHRTRVGGGGVKLQCAPSFLPAPLKWYTVVTVSLTPAWGKCPI